METKKGAYGSTAGGGDTHRKTWDRDEYARKAAEREAKFREQGRARYEAALQGKKYVERATTPPDAKETEARAQRLDVTAQIGKTMLVPAGAGVGKRGRGAGFYCETCDLTFKDNLQWVEHLNSKQHLFATGQSGLVREASVQEVRDRLAWLKRRRDEERAKESLDLSARLEMAVEADERTREEKRRKRNEKRRKTKDGLGHAKPEFEDDGVIC